MGAADASTLRRVALAISVTASLAAPAQAQLFRAYLESTGSDANPCTLQQPCRLLPAALTAVADGGEIWMLDSANYNTSLVNINKSVTILAVPGALGSVVTNGSNALQVSGVDIEVALRNLVIVHLGTSAHGIHFTAGASLNVADCEIRNMEAIAINAAAPNSVVSISNTVIRGSSNGISVNGAVTATLDRVQVSGANYGVFANNGARVYVRDSVLAGNSFGVVANSVPTPVRVAVSRTVLNGNATGVYAVAGGAGGSAEVLVSESTLTNQSGTAIWAAEVDPSASATITADSNWITENGTGFLLGAGPPVIYTRGNNTLLFNLTNVSGGALTALATQ